MFYLLARLLGPRVRRGVVWLLVGGCIWLFADNVPVWGGAALHRAESWIVAQGWGAPLLDAKAHIAIAYLELEQQRLRALQAKAEASAAASQQELAQITAQRTALQEEMLLLAQALKGVRLMDATTQRVLSANEVSLRAEAALQAYADLEQQHTLYQRAYTLQQQSAQRAAILQDEATRRIAAIQAHRAMLAAQNLWHATTGAEQDAVAELEAELDYAWRLADARAALAGELAWDEVGTEVRPAPPMPTWQRNCAHAAANSLAANNTDTMAALMIGVLTWIIE